MMRIVHVTEAEEGVVHVTTEALHGLLTQAGWKLSVHDGTHREYIRSYPDPDDTHPSTMIGRR